MGITADTHEFYTELKNAGFSEQQAETIAKIQIKTASAALEQARRDYELDNLATKRDLKELETKLEAKIKEMETNLQMKIAESKADLQRWMVTLIVSVGFMQTSVIAAIIMRATGKF